MIGRSRTGTGKTLAFGLPAVTRLHELGAGRVDKDGNRAPRGRRPSMIVMAPTRELARQVAEELTQVAKPVSLYRAAHFSPRTSPNPLPQPRPPNPVPPPPPTAEP